MKGGTRKYERVIWEKGAMAAKWKGESRLSSHHFPTVLISCSCFLNSADPTISGPRSLEASFGTYLIRQTLAYSSVLDYFSPWYYVKY